MNPFATMDLSMYEPWLTVYVFVIGLVFGSFVNVCIYRLPVGKSVVRPRSACPACGTPIRWYQNIPVLSWMFLGGKCGACGARISVRYPIIELLCGLVVLGLWVGLGPSIAFAVAAPFALAMIVLFFTDWDHQLLPDAITLTGLCVGLAIAWFNPFLAGEGWARVWSSLAGAAVGSGSLWGVGALYGRWRGVEAMGLGDVKMMAMVGAFSGVWGSLSRSSRAPSSARSSGWR